MRVSNQSVCVGTLTLIDDSSRVMALIDNSRPSFYHSSNPLNKTANTALHVPYGVTHAMQRYMRHIAEHAPYSVTLRHTALHAPLLYSVTYAIQRYTRHTALHAPLQSYMRHTALHAPLQSYMRHTPLHAPLQSYMRHTALHTPYSVTCAT